MLDLYLHFEKLSKKKQELIIIVLIFKQRDRVDSCRSRIKFNIQVALSNQLHVPSFDKTNEISLLFCQLISQGELYRICSDI